MKTTPLLALVICAALSSAAWSRLADEDWEGSLNLGAAGVFESAAQHPAAADPAAAASARQKDPVCFEYGRRTETVPSWRRGPLETLCDGSRDPLTDAASVQAAFDKVAAKIRAEDTRPPAGPIDDYFPPGAHHFESGVGRGTPTPEKMDAAAHWADVAILHLHKNPDGSYGVLGGVLSTRRANKMPGYDDLEALRVDFDMGPSGELRAAHISRGLRMKGADRMSWNGPLDSPNRQEDLRGLWTIRYHQLLKAWADGTEGIPNTSPRR